MTYDEIKKLIDEYGKPAISDFLQFLQPELYDRLKPKETSQILLIGGNPKIGTSYIYQQVLKLNEERKIRDIRRSITYIKDSKNKS